MLVNQSSLSGHTSLNAIITLPIVYVDLSLSMVVIILTNAPF